MSGSRAARREICPDAIEPRRPRRAGRANKLSASLAGRADVGVVVAVRVVSVCGRWWCAPAPALACCCADGCGSGNG